MHSCSLSLNLAARSNQIHSRIENKFLFSSRMYNHPLQVFSLLLIFVATTVFADLLVLPDGQTTTCHKLTAYVADWVIIITYM